MRRQHASLFPPSHLLNRPQLPCACASLLAGRLVALSAPAGKLFICSQAPHAVCIAPASLTGELRFQELADPSSGTPPYLIAKGASAGGFRAGAPATAWGPDLPGYTRYISGGLYGQRGTYCADTLL